MAREMAVQMLYQVDLGGSTVAEARASFDLPSYLTLDDAEGGDEAGERPARRASGARLEEGERAFAQACDMVAGTRAHLEEIDARLRRQAENWRLERMPPVDRNILRLAVWEILHETDVPPLVVLDEAVELAKRFGSEQSSRFVNGLLDGVLRSVQEVGGAR